MAPNRRQSIIWIIDGIVYRRKYTSFGRDVLNKFGDAVKCYIVNISAVKMYLPMNICKHYLLIQDDSFFANVNSGPKVIFPIIMARDVSLKCDYMKGRNGCLTTKRKWYYTHTVLQCSCRWISLNILWWYISIRWHVYVNIWTQLCSTLTWLYRNMPYSAQYLNICCKRSRLYKFCSIKCDKLLLHHIKTSCIQLNH